VSERSGEPVVVPLRGWSLADAVASQRRFVYLLIALLCAGGIWAALRLPSAIYPELQFPRITIVAPGRLPGLDTVPECAVFARWTRTSASCAGHSAGSRIRADGLNRCGWPGAAAPSGGETR
jgi:hypothetical protein